MDLLPKQTAVNRPYLWERVHALFAPEDLQDAGTYGTTGSWIKFREHIIIKCMLAWGSWCHAGTGWTSPHYCTTVLPMTLHKCHVHRVICWLTPVDLFLYGATPLTWWSDRVAAWSGQTRTWHQTAGWVRGHVRDGPHSSAGGLVVHSDTVRVGATHRVVGFAVMATDLFWLSAAFLRTEHTRHYLHYGKFFLYYTYNQKLRLMYC